jgi:hypothetical protein
MPISGEVPGIDPRDVEKAKFTEVVDRSGNNVGDETKVVSGLQQVGAEGEGAYRSSLKGRVTRFISRHLDEYLFYPYPQKKFEKAADAAGQRAIEDAITRDAHSEEYIEGLTDEEVAEFDAAVIDGYRKKQEELSKERRQSELGSRK